MGQHCKARSKFIYSEKATKFCEIFNYTKVHTVKSKVKISQHFVAFSEYMNFNHAENESFAKIFFVILMRKSNSNRCRNDKFVDSFIGFPELSKRLLAEQKKSKPLFHNRWASCGSSMKIALAHVNRT